MLLNVTVMGLFDVAMALLEHPDINANIMEKSKRNLLHILASKPESVQN